MIFLNCVYDFFFSIILYNFPLFKYICRFLTQLDFGVWNPPVQMQVQVNSKHCHAQTLSRDYFVNVYIRVMWQIYRFVTYYLEYMILYDFVISSHYGCYL